MNLKLIRNDRWSDENHENAIGIEIAIPGDRGDSIIDWWYFIVVPPSRNYRIPANFLLDLGDVLRGFYGRRNWTREFADELSKKASDILGSKVKAMFDGYRNQSVFFIMEDSE